MFSCQVRDGTFPLQLLVETPASSNVLSAWSFVHNISSGNEITGQKASLKFREIIAAAIFFLLAFRPNCCETFTFVLFYEGCFLLMTCSSEFTLFLVPHNVLTLHGTEAVQFLSRTHLSSLDIILKAPHFCSWSFFSVALLTIVEIGEGYRTELYCGFSLAACKGSDMQYPGTWWVPAQLLFKKYSLS